MERPTFEKSLETPEPGPRWVKSSRRFFNGNCVEVADLPGHTVGFRDSKDPEGPVLPFTSGEWRAFLGAVRNGEFGRRVFETRRVSDDHW